MKETVLGAPEKEPNDFGGPVRQKYWSELTAEEKLERMRGILKNAIGELNHVRQELLRLRKHQHSQVPNATLLFPDETGYFGQEELKRASDPDREWF